MNKKKLKAIAEAPEEVKKQWSETQQFIAQVVHEIQKELGKDFDGDVDNETS